MYEGDELLRKLIELVERYDLLTIIESEKSQGETPRRLVFKPEILLEATGSGFPIGDDGSTPLRLAGLPVWVSRFIEGMDVLVDTSRAPLAEEVQAKMILTRRFRHYAPPPTAEEVERAKLPKIDSPRPGSDLWKKITGQGDR